MFPPCCVGEANVTVFLARNLGEKDTRKKDRSG